MSLTGSSFINTTLTPVAGYAVTVSAIQFGIRSTSTGATKYEIAASVGGGARFVVTSAGGTSLSTSTWQLKGPTVFGTPVQGGNGQSVQIFVFLFAEGE